MNCKFFRDKFSDGIVAYGRYTAHHSFLRSRCAPCFQVYKQTVARTRTYRRAYELVQRGHSWVQLVTRNVYLRSRILGLFGCVEMGHG
jgi:hypothetical protein